ncbi:MAG: electron transfer flavoprotein [Smithellaceae bacterium]
MNIVVCFKVVPDEQDIVINANGELSFERAKPAISAYDLNAVEAGAQLVEAQGGTLTALSVGSSQINESKLKKNILSRGPQKLYMIADDRLKDADTHQTARALQTAIDKLGEYDLILCGEGSADLYAQQTGAQLGQLLKLPAINSISKISVADGKIVAERTLEDEVETLQIPLPAVISVTSDINIPRIAGMKQILEAGKKPSTVWSATDAGLKELEPTINIIETKAPKQADRKQDIIESDSDEAIQSFTAKILEVIRER